MSGKWTLEKFGERDEARQRGELNCKVELCVRQKERRSFVLLGIRNGEERSRAVDSAAMTSAGDRLQLRSFQLGGGGGGEKWGTLPYFLQNHKGNVDNLLIRIKRYY